MAEDCCFVAAGDHVACLTLPKLELRWSAQADDATVFGLYALPGGTDLLVHGELTICRMNMNAKVVWVAHGADIFKGPVAIGDDHVEAEDFNGVKYRFSLATGAAV